LYLRVICWNLILVLAGQNINNKDTKNVQMYKIMNHTIKL